MLLCLHRVAIWVVKESNLSFESLFSTPFEPVRQFELIRFEEFASLGSSMIGRGTLSDVSDIPTQVGSSSCCPVTIAMSASAICVFRIANTMMRLYTSKCYALQLFELPSSRLRTRVTLLRLRDCSLLYCTVQQVKINNCIK